MDSTLRFLAVSASGHTDTFAQLVGDGLSRPQKSLPCRFFYDSVGSHLFERICKLPEYYLTRTEQCLLEEEADAMIAAAGENITLVEFGSGSSCKTRLLINALLRRQSHLHYVPIDISAGFLHASAVTLLKEYEGLLSVTAIAAEYNAGIESLPDHGDPRLILFLGSNIGNFEPEEAVAFLARIRRRMNPADRILIGVDLVKDKAILEPAYNDSQGVTAAFNKNLLVRINAELNTNFDLAGFAHSAPFVEERSRIEMRLVSRRRQTVTLPTTGQEFSFAAGEYIHTENSHKYTPHGFAELCRAARLEIQAQWSDARCWFAVMLLKPNGD